MTRRVLRWFALGVGILLATVLLIASWGIGTHSGSNAVWGMLSKSVPGLEIGSLEGRFAGPLVIRNLRYSDAFKSVSIESIALDWRPRRLLAMEVAVEQLDITGVGFTLLQSAPPPEQTTEFRVPSSIELPVDVVLTRLTVEDIAFRSSPDAAPMVVDQGQLVAQLRQHALRIENLSISGPLFSIQGSSSTLTRDAYSSDTTIIWELRPADLATAKGTLQLRGNLDSLRIDHRMDPPYAIEQTVTLQNMTRDLIFNAETQVDQLRLAALGGNFPEVTVSGSLNATGGIDDLAFDASFNAFFGAQSLEAVPLSLLLEGTLRQQILTLSQLAISDPESLALNATGAIDLGGVEPSFQWRSNWKSLRWPLVGPAKITGAVGAATIDGTLANYAVHLESSLDVPKQAGGTLSVDGSGNRDSFELSTLQVELLDGYLNGRAQLQWTPNLEGSVTLTGEGIDPSLVADALPGDLQLNIRARGGNRDGAFTADIEALDISGSLRDLPVNLQLLGQFELGQFEIETLQLRSGSTELSAQGQAGETLNLNWSMHSPDLGELLPDASGSLKGRGHLGGNRTLPTLQGSLQGAGLRYARYALNTLSLQADIDLDNPKPSSLVLTMDDGSMGDIALSNLTLNAVGTRAAHNVQLAATTSAGNAELYLGGELLDGEWIARLSDAQLQYSELSPWTLVSPHTIDISREQQSIHTGCWTSGEARLCFDGQRIADAVSANMALTELALDYFQSLLPSDIALSGNVSGEASLRSTANNEPEVNAQVRASDLAVHLRQAGKQTTEMVPIVALKPSSLTVQSEASGMQLTLRLPFLDKGGISAEMLIDAGTAPLEERPLRGRLDVEVPDISWLRLLAPELEQASGALRGDLDIAGSLAAPGTKGQFALSDGMLQLATPGLEIRDIGIQATISSALDIDFTGSAKSGGGELDLAGTVKLLEEWTEADVSVNGEAFQVVNTRDARVFVSPALRIAMDENGTRVSGDVTVPSAQITPRELPASAVSVSDDQVIVTDNDADAPIVVNRNLETRVRVSLGDDVSVDGFGFKGRLTGALLVEQAKDRPTLGTGELNIVDGEYRAYGQGLVIDEGKILFSGGPVDEPAIRVRAVRRPANDILVGVRVRGPVEEPEFSLFSEPGMGQTEQLSWLLLGRPLEGSSEGQEDMLAQAATLLGLRGGNYLADRFGSGLGVDSIGFETGSGEAGAASDVNQAAFVIGKYLSPDLFVSYGIGLFDSISTIRLEYILNKHWKISSESSTIASGGDVTYTVER